MSARYLILCAALLLPAAGLAQRRDFADWGRYARENKELGAPRKGERRVVFMGNSITRAWPVYRPEFFSDNGFICRGVSGENSYQLLLRFREDVLKLRPRVVVIACGTNDIAETSRRYDEELTLGNIQSMAELARANGARPVLTSCLPASGFSWNKSVTDSMDKIRSLNARVKAWAESEKIPYVDYFSALLNDEGTGMRTALAEDYPGVHPVTEGYLIMEGLLLPVIKRLR